MNRRAFLKSSLAASLAASLPTLAQASRPPRILLRNGWQSVNIGDIAHPVGMMTLIEKHLPDVEVRLWYSELGNGAEQVLSKRFPKLVFVKGKEELAKAFSECDFLLHGSGSGFGAAGDVARWRKQTSKPYGVNGISFFRKSPEQIDTLTNAKFVYFRDGVSLQFAKDAGVKCPVMEFGPDSAFGVTDLRNDEAATAFLKTHNLHEGKFLCCIPRYRWTPYWTINTDRPFDETKNQRNQEMKEHDHAQLREAIIAVTRETEMKVLVCPEDMTQVQLGKEMVFDPLPEETKKKVVWRDRYWLTDEAVSTYVRSAGLFGNEMHSPIMCITNDIPAIVCRFAEQTSKGYMWRDIGLGDWLFDLDDEEQVKKIAPTVLALAKDPAGARAKVMKAREVVRERQKAGMQTLKASLPRPA